MRLLFLYGMPATGKLTVARELAQTTGFKLFHNHLAVDLLLSVFDFGTAPFVQLREEIWLSVFQQACQTDLPGLIFTFAPESTVRPEFLTETQEILSRAGGQLDFVELTCPADELKLRLASDSRQSFGKLTSVELFEDLLDRGIFDSPAMPRPRLTIDTSVLSPAQAADAILLALGLCKP